MKKLTFALASAALAIPATAFAQSAQERLDARYDRALAAGYKALFLCSAIANAEANGASRTPESVHDWELTGIQAPLDSVIRDLPYEIVRRPSGQIAHVQVEWANDMPDRMAQYYGPDTGCSVLPIGAPEGITRADQPADMPPAVSTAPRAAGSPLIIAADGSRSRSRLSGVFDSAFGTEYGEGRTTAVFVRTVGDNGKMASEYSRYAPGFGKNTPQRTWSVAKSIASTLVGMAVHSGEFAVEDPVGL
ncbi:MAG: serine hydrolase, partial [Pseudomonadota bacterium]